MAAITNDRLSIHNRNGSTQESRYRKDLDPSQLQLMELGVEDWVIVACKLAKELNYFNSSNQVDGDWVQFFKQVMDTQKELGQASGFELDTIKNQIQKSLESYEKQGNLTPHLTLFISFLKLLEISRSQFNGLTKRHLDFYYQEVLKFEKQAPTSDSVFVVLELAKAASNHRLAAGTSFLAGKNEAGENLLYKSSSETVINAIQVADIRTIFHHPQNGTLAQAIIKDWEAGDGEAIQKQESWPTFGESTGFEDSNQTRPKIGFVIASPTLWMQEGERWIVLEFEFEAQIPFSSVDLVNALQLSISTKKEWVGLDLLPSDVEIANPKKLKLTIHLDNGFPSVVPLVSKDPVWSQLNSLAALKFEWEVKDEDAYVISQYFAKVGFTSIDLTVDVSEVRNVPLENDQTLLNPTKPFFPFSTRPFAGSSFNFGYGEAFKKNCTEVNLSFVWKNTPADFREHYSAYVEQAKENVSTGFYVTAQNAMVAHHQMLTKAGSLITNYPSINFTIPVRKMEGRRDATAEPVSSRTTASMIVNSNEFFTYRYQVLQNGQLLRNNSDAHLLFKKIEGSNDFHFDLRFTQSISQMPQAKIRVNLQQSFLHELYPKILAMVLTSEEKDKILPNEPYTPLAADLKLSYKAHTQITQEYGNDKLFYIHPFGLGERTGKTLLSSSYKKGGHLYLGLSHALANDTLSLLFQLEEGTENSLEVTSEAAEWSVLGSSGWQVLSKDAILLNETKNFLSSGIISIQLPATITHDNPAFPLGLTWLRIKLNASSDAVCRCYHIHAQAVRLEAMNPWKATHLPNQLPSKTISKLEQRSAPIKSIAQPYASVGGKGLESDLNFYRRISERLRHKKRAVTLWDFEHLVLEEYPEILLAKCLNHTKGTCYHAAGHVTVVVVPKHRPLDMAALNYPMVSEAKRLEIQEFLQQFISPAISVHVVNPTYAQVDIQVRAQFRVGLDRNFYEQELKKALTNFLSPWAFDLRNSFNFNREIHRSQVVYFVENLEYVDFIGGLSWRIGLQEQGKKIHPDTPATIIVSGSTHQVNPVNHTCSK
ncbi:MAG: baseplate J/gp47 family protein [Mongoliitalea sp.]